ncbi:MAG: helix-turn-helix domain-containing protein [Pseudomonadota bacterium]
MSAKRLAREDWLALGLAQLAEHGPGALKLAQICAAAGMTRGSFYHHFADHGAFLEALILHRHAEEENVLAEMLPAGTPPADALDRLTDLALDLDFRLELGLRELAREHAPVAAAMERVDATRLALMVPLYAARYSIGEAEARDASLLEYATFLGLMLMDPTRSTEEQRRLYEVYLAMQSARYERPA